MRCFYMGRSTRSGLPKVAGRLERSLQGARKVDIRLPGTGNSNSHGARLVY